MTIQELALRLPEDESERILGEALRAEPEADRLRVIHSLLASRDTTRAGLRLAASCLTDPRSMLSILGLALDRGDPSILPVWYGPLAPRVGYRLLFQFLDQRLKVDPTSVRRARYWLPTWLPAGSQPATELLGKLDQELNSGS